MANTETRTIIPESCVQVIDALRRKRLFDTTLAVMFLGLNAADGVAVLQDCSPSSFTSPPFYNIRIINN